MTRTQSLIVYFLLAFIAVGVAASNWRDTRPVAVQPTPQPVAQGRFNYRVADSATYSTLDIATLLPQAERPRRLFENWYSIQGGGLTQGAVVTALGSVIVDIEPDYAIALGQPVHRDYTDGLQFLAIPNDPLIGQQYTIGKLGLADAWNVSKGDGVVIAVVDSGIECTHPDLAGKCVPGRSFVDGVTSTEDDHGHGTHVAGIAAASTNNSIGVSGVGFSARLLPIKSLMSTGGGYHSWIAEGITYAADNGAKVINLSLGGTATSNTLEAALRYAVSRGSLPVCASGNSGDATLQYPAAYKDCLAVGATTANDTRASFSSYGKVDVGAPGEGILSTVRGGQYQAWNGTSMATPNISGLAALIFARYPNYSPAQVRAVIENTADSIIGGGVGKGRANARTALSGSPIPPPQPQPTTQPVPTQPTAPRQSGAGSAADVENLINAERSKLGLSPLRVDARLRVAADAHNQTMYKDDCFSHQCPGEVDVAQRIRNAGYPLTSGGEVIGKGYSTPRDIVDAWLNSAGHRAAILNTSWWGDFGCAVHDSLPNDGWDNLYSCELASGGGGGQPPIPQPQPTATPFKPPATATPWYNPPPAPTATRFVPVPATAAPPGAGLTCPPGYRCAFIAPGTVNWRVDLGWANVCGAGDSKVRCLP